MTHNTQGGIARYFTKDNIDGARFTCPPDETVFTINLSDTGTAIVSWPCDGETRQQAYEPEEVAFHLNMNDWRPILDESPLPASPEGTWETEFEKLYAKKNYYNLVSFVQSIFQPLQQELSEHKRAIELISSQYQYRVRENERLNKVLSESIQTGEKAIERIGELEKQLAEAREAWKDAIIELKAAKAVYVGISIEHPKIKPQCDALIEGIDAVISKSSALK